MHEGAIMYFLSMFKSCILFMRLFVRLGGSPIFASIQAMGVLSCTNTRSHSSPSASCKSTVLHLCLNCIFVQSLGFSMRCPRRCVSTTVNSVYMKGVMQYACVFNVIFSIFDFFKRKGSGKPPFF